MLLAGLRGLGGNSGGNSQGVLTDRVDVLSNGYCVNLLDMTIRWSPTREAISLYRLELSRIQALDCQPCRFGIWLR